jgi:LCP family protein required for cell wall assembly
MSDVASPLLTTTEQSQSDTFSLKKTIGSAIGLTFLFVLLFIAITTAALGIFAYQKATQFVLAADTSFAELKQLADEAWVHEPTVTNGHKNILLLGVDSLAQRGDIPALTDTMMLLSIDVTTGKLHTLSFPRDLWSESYKTKINALYFYGQERYPDSPEQFPAEVLSDLTGIPIHHTLVLSLDQVAHLIDILGGVTVEVETGFIDTQFPREDVDIYSVSDPKALYKTISFEAGIQHFTAKEALEYMRSRHSGDEEGTDDARAARQQQVIAGVLSNLKQRDFYIDTERLGRLYQFYSSEFESALSIKEALSTARILYPYRESIELSRSIFSIYPEDPQGVITHPKVTRLQPQWIYQIVDPVAFKTFAQESIGMEVPLTTVTDDSNVQ